MKNRYGDEYWFDQVQPNLYTIKGDLKYWRFGGREGQEKIDLNDLGYVDPSGGPWLAVGMSIESRTIKKISASGDLDEVPQIVFEVD
jgi:hypothetical protein